ncbi:ankyrin repeat-containing protein At5g02620-like [Rhododendron vialii]|uniref:ankyrin repeat-containing protein At5g02620-like n=1 Tax=Rhododendron vialii TaxID=182163 RepID=UPI0026604040|nr:ankyrin repeat-containing protein At5g02620-like [Rhododendron vialii]
MEKQNSFRGANMEKQVSFQGVKMEKQKSFHGVMEKQQSFRGGGMEKQKSFRGLMEKQKSFRIAFEKQLSFGGDRKKIKESPGKRGDMPLHLAARAGNLSKVRDILQRFDADVVKELISKQNQEGETALYVAAENGHAHVVSELLKHIDLQTASIAAKNGLDTFHIATKQGHIEVLKELLQSFPNLVMTTDSSNSTALHTAAAQGHIDAVNLLLETDSNLAKIARNNGKTVLHTAARMGHVEVVKSLLRKDSGIGLRIDKKGQTALHMAVKGQSVEIVLELGKPDPTVLNLEDNKGNTALHIATGKGKAEMVRCLLSVEGVNINAMNKGGDTPLDIAEKFGNPTIITILRESGAMNSKDLGKPQNPAKQLKQTVSDIKHDVKSQLQQTRQTGFRVKKIAKRLEKLHISGLNNAINSATVVAVLIATVAFAAIFTVPGQYVEEQTSGFSLGQAHIARKAAFIVFFVSDSAALFISLAVVVVQTSVVVIEHKAKKQLVFVINKLMWLACLSISIAFISLSYVVVGAKEEWLAVSTTLIGSVIMVATIGSMCFCVIRHRMEETKMRNIRRAETLSRSFSMSVASDTEMLNESYNKRMYAV